MRFLKKFACIAALLALLCVSIAACGEKNQSSDIGGGTFSSSDDENSSSIDDENGSSIGGEGDASEYYYITIVRADGKTESPVTFTADNFAEVFSDVLQNRLTSDTEKYEYAWKDDLPEEFELRNYVLTEIRSLKRYTITFLNYDGSVWAKLDFNYGEIPSISDVPARNPDGGVEYEFFGWSPALSVVIENAEYTACFKIKQNNETKPLPIG